MATKLVKAANTTVSSSSIDITSGIAASIDGLDLEVVSRGAAIWINIVGGTAAAAAANNIPLGDGESIQFRAPSGTTALTAIRAAAVDSVATVTQIGS